MSKRTGGRTIILGLDGATFTLLEPWMEGGVLPTLRGIRDAGVQAPLASTVPPITAPAWPAFMTGKNPGKLGFTFFYRWQSGSYREVPVDSTSFQGSTLWDLLGSAGHRVGVLNVPITYPAWPINGVMVADVGTGRDDPGAAHPLGLMSELEERFGPYRFGVDTPPIMLESQSAATVDALLRDCHELLDHRFKLARWLLGREQLDVLMLTILETDRLQHWLWNLLDASHPAHDAALAEQFGDRIVDYYRAIDAHLGELLAEAGSEATVVVMSDHGFGPGSRTINLAAWLLERGYQRIKKGPASRLRLALWRRGWTPGLIAEMAATGQRRFGFLRRLSRNLARRPALADRRRNLERLRRAGRFLFLSMSDIDWERTRAYCLRGPGQIRVNLRGREPRGAVAADEYEALVQEIIAELAELEDPATGRAVNGRTYARGATFHGPLVEQLPDVTLDPIESGYSVVNWADFMFNEPFVDNRVVSGIHRSDGVLLARGPGLRQGVRLDSASLMDVAPTILYLAGCPVPGDMDGQVLAGAVEPELLLRRPVERAADTARDREARGSAVTDEQMAERLRGLGYVD